MEISPPVLSNSVLWVLFVLANLGLTLLVFRFFGKYGLYGVIVAAVITANIQVIKTVEVFGFVSTLGNILYGGVFFATDILNEIYGKKVARRGVWLGFIGMALMALWMQFGLKFIPHPSDFSQDALSAIFSLMPRIAAGSMVAYLVSQHHDIWAFLFWKRKTKGRFLWLRNNVSTLASQAIDTAIFCTIALWGLFDFNTWLQILASTYIIKLFVAVIDTPFIYLAKIIAKSVPGGNSSTGYAQ